MYTAENPPPYSDSPGDPVWLLVTAEVAVEQGYPAELIGKYIINGRVPFPDES